MNKEVINKLLEEAKNMANQNFCCYHTGYTVGTALLTADGKIYRGFNVENDGILSICGERAAFVKALTGGNKDFIALAVVGKKVGDPYFKKTTPCGYCRQFMREYTKDGFTIITYDEINNDITTYKIEDLLPESYREELEYGYNQKNQKN